MTNALGWLVWGALAAVAWVLDVVVGYEEAATCGGRGDMSSE